MRARCRAVLIPFAEGGETEQNDRARRLAKLELAAVVPEVSLTTESLAQAMAAAPEPRGPALNLDGAAETARILARHLTARQCA